MAADQSGALPAPEPVEMRRRSIPDRLRYCAERLCAHPGDLIVAAVVAAVLEMVADELDPKGRAVNEDSPIADLGLPVRTHNALARAGVTTVAALTARNGWELLGLPAFGCAGVFSFGRAAYREIVAALARHGLELKPAPSGWPQLPKVGDLATQLRQGGDR